MTDYLNFITPTIESLGGFGYWLVFLIAFAESLAFVGTLIPGSILIYLAGFLASRGYFDVINLIWFATAGAILGDGLSYFLGTKGKVFFRNENRFLKLSHLEKGEEFFEKHGPKSVFLGRFVGPLRPIVPFIAGISRMKMRTFFLWNISSAFLWAVSHLLIGYFFGGAIDAIEAWTTRVGIVVAAIAVTLVVLWIVLKKGRPVFVFFRNYFVSMKERFAASDFTERFVSKHPVTANLVTGRFSPARFSGVPLTLLSLSFLYVVFLFFGSVKSALSSGAIALSDQRVAGLFLSLRDLELFRFFGWVTLLANWQVILALALVATLIFSLWRKEFYTLPLWVILGGSGLFNFLSEIAFYREHPEASFYLREGSSFPNSHSVMAAAFYGFIVYILVRHSGTWGRKTNILFFGMTVILRVGFGALYLGEGFLSDVWGGYLLGILWLMIGISLAELLKPDENIAAGVKPAENAKMFSAVALAAWLVFYVSFSASYRPIANAPKENESIFNVSEVSAIFKTGKIPKFSEKIFGTRFQPLNFIIIAENEEKLVDSMDRAGWLSADEVDTKNLLKLLESEALNKNYPKAPMTPSFWNAGVNDFAFEKEAAADVYSRRHLRIWKTDFETPGGRVYAGTVRLDTVKWIFIHESSPYVDVERELLFSDLSAAGVVAESKKLQFTEPIAASEDLSETPFVTDGGLYEVVLK